MEEFSIIVNDDNSRVKNNLIGCLDTEFGNDMGVFVKDCNNYVHLKLRDGDKRSKMASALAKTIMQTHERELINKVINSNYFYFNTLERRKILNHSLQYINDEADNLAPNIYNLRRLNVIKRTVDEYLAGHNEFNLEGFVNFRLKPYIDELEEVVDKAVDDFMVEKEYTEFIQLLKFFVDSQPFKHEIIHIIVTHGNQYKLHDSSNQEITTEYEREVMRIDDEEFNNDEILVSSLITLAPKRIVLHNENLITNTQMFKTIKEVFQGKITTCSGCKICCMAPQSQ